jgi:putative ABC transport system permease protein
VAVIGSGVMNTLFNGEDPVGQTIRINNVGFKVIGVLESKGGSGFGNQDDQILVPLTTVNTRLQRGNFRGSNLVNQISVQATDEKQMALAIQQISEVLRERHKIRFEDDFTVRSQEDLLATANQITGVFTLFLGGVAGISLLVGGIGIMNIMLVSVTERTREIGIRKAIGATRSNILAQFLTEATVLSIMGGLIGILLGAGLARLISTVSAGSTFTLNSVVTADSVLMATLFATAVGLFFGIYPAYRAASLHPIDALRYE